MTVCFRFAALTCLPFLLSGRIEAESFRPLRTQGTQTLKALAIEVDLAVEYRDEVTFPFVRPSEQPKRTEMQGPRMGLNLGLADNAELQFDYTYLFIDEEAPGVGDQAGSGDARFFTKWRVLDQTKWLPDLAIHMGAKLPNADDIKRLGTDQADVFFSFLIGRNYQKLETAINVGLGIIGSHRRLIQDDVLLYGVAAIYKPTDKLHLAAELNGVTESHNDLNEQSAFLGAIRYQMGPVRFYLGGSAGLVARSEEYGVLGGFTWTRQF